MLNFTNLKLKKIKLEKLGVLAFFALFTITSFLTGSSVSNAASSGASLPISFGGTGASTQAGALTNLGINNTIDENSNNGTFPSAKTVYAYMNKAMVNCDNSTGGSGDISSDNTNFYNTICSWTGGDLIYKGSGLSTTADNNRIKVGGKACTTSGQGYTSNSAAGDSIPQVGCVLPDLQAGTHAVTISVNRGSTYTINAGNVVYAEDAKLSNCDTTSMQTFGANAAACKASMQQGQVIVLNDTRNNQKYRVKKMPDGNVWMIDSLKLGSTASTTTLTPADTNITTNYTLPQIKNSTSNSDPSGTTYCSSSGLVNTHNPGNTTACGYLYDWTTAIAGTSSDSGYSISAKGWSLPSAHNAKSIDKLSNAMISAGVSNNHNPVYTITGYKNLAASSSTNYPAPWLGVYSGYFYSSGSGLNAQGEYGFYWSSTYHIDDYSILLRFNFTMFDIIGTKLFYGDSVRSVL
ncbi:MAG: IPT/TIG domain-containing protein [Bifidobacteriaceae bacterium]|jgi:uncharacterized protein (TIGR02145 family)|nr:IPT/TIG domain-containing protein [Bifidobacteriaceae bacterium]